MALTRAELEARRVDVLAALRRARYGAPRPVVELRLQRGRRRPLVRGRVRLVAPSGAFVLLEPLDVPADAELLETPADPLHVPVGVIRSVQYPK